jgi:hypothetical protein
MADRDIESVVDAMVSTTLAERVVIDARRTVCAHSESVAEAAETMRMLGIHPDQEDEEDPTVAPAILPTYLNRSHRA